MTGTDPTTDTANNRSTTGSGTQPLIEAPDTRQFRTDDRSVSPLPWVLSGSGALLIAIHVPHFAADLAEDVGLFAILSGVIAPIILSFALVVAGIELDRSTLDRQQTRRVCAWTLVGAIFLLAIGGISYGYQVSEGAVLTHVNYVLGNFLTGGAIAGFIVGWFDAHGHLRREELRGFLEAVEHTGHAVYITRTDGTIEYVNEAFVEQTGYDRGEALGRTPALLNSGEQSAAFYDDLWSTITAGEVWRGELVNRRADDTLYHVDQTIAPVVDNRGTIERFVAINAEISDLKAYEAALERRNHQLEQFASILSHDLRNPLNVAAGRADLVASAVDNPHIDPLQDALDRMDRLISDVLQLTRADATELETTPVDVGAVARDAWTCVDTRNATLDIDHPGTVEGSEAQLRQLFENLIRNSIEHGGSGVTITVDALDDGFFVADDGIGIPDAEQEAIFESGYTTSQEGTGLGLEIVSRIAAGHDWNVSVTESTSGGARFEFTPESVTQEPRQAMQMG